MRVWQHLYWTDDIWRFLETMGYLGVWTLWDLLNVGYAGLDLITSAKSLVPHFNVNWKSLVQEKHYEFDHDAVVMDVSTAVTAVEDDVTSSTAASGTLTPPASQAQKKKKREVDHFHLDDLVPTLCDGVPTPVFDWTAPRISQSSGSSVYPIWSSTADWLHPVTWERV